MDFSIENNFKELEMKENEMSPMKHTQTIIKQSKGARYACLRPMTIDFTPFGHQFFIEVVLSPTFILRRVQQLVQVKPNV